MNTHRIHFYIPFKDGSKEPASIDADLSKTDSPYHAAEAMCAAMGLDFQYEEEIVGGPEHV